jgi:hypothetical protein
LDAASLVAASRWMMSLGIDILLSDVMVEINSIHCFFSSSGSSMFQVVDEVFA